MKRIKIRAIVERIVYLNEDDWEGFNEELPQDIEDLDMLEDEACVVEVDLLKAELLDD